MARGSIKYFVTEFCNEVNSVDRIADPSVRSEGLSQDAGGEQALQFSELGNCDY